MLEGRFDQTGIPGGVYASLGSLVDVEASEAIDGDILVRRANNWVLAQPSDLLDGRYVNISGDTMNGNLIIPPAKNSNEAVNKSQLDTKADKTELDTKADKSDLNGKLNRDKDEITNADFEIRGPGTLWLHEPGVTRVALRSGMSNGYFCLNVSSQISETDYVPVKAGSPRELNDLATAQWVHDNFAPRFSGPHYLPGGSYMDVPSDGEWHGYPSGALTTAAIQQPGLYHLMAMAYMFIDGITAPSGSLYFTIRARWMSGAEFTWRNGNITLFSRLTAGTGQRARITGFAQGYVENRPGDRICYVGAGSRIDKFTTAQIGGNYRLMHAFYPNSKEAGLSTGWVNF